MKSNQIKWFRRLYFGESAAQKKEKAARKLTDGSPHPGIYLIVLPSNEANLLDILPQPVILQPHYRKTELFVVGIALGKTEAMKLAGKIVMETYRETGRTDVKTYLGDDYTDGMDFESGREPLYRTW